MEEKIIVTLTTWSKRIDNIPTILDTIFKQTLPPDLVVLNLAFEEIVPDEVQSYISKHNIEINRVKDTKVYKKLIPTLKKYPNDCVISIDDDWLYPQGMIEEFISIHKKYPNLPISGNRVIVCGMQCHCGCASLTKASYFGEYLNVVDDDVMMNCPSDDMVYTYFATKSGHPYVRTEHEYYENMEPFNAQEGYSQMTDEIDPILVSLRYLEKRFGKVKIKYEPYINDKCIADLIDEIRVIREEQYINETIRETEERIYSTYSFRVGQAIVKPFRWMKGL